MCSNPMTHTLQLGWNCYGYSGKQKLLKNLNKPLPYYTTIALLGIDFKERKTNVDRKKPVHVDIYCCFIHNIKKLETAQMSFNGSVVKQTVAHPHSEKLFSK